MYSENLKTAKTLSDHLNKKGFIIQSIQSFGGYITLNHTFSNCESASLEFKITANRLKFIGCNSINNVEFDKIVKNIICEVEKYIL